MSLYMANFSWPFEFELIFRGFFSVFSFGVDLTFLGVSIGLTSGLLLLLGAFFIFAVGSSLLLDNRTFGSMVNDIRRKLLLENATGEPQHLPQPRHLEGIAFDACGINVTLGGLQVVPGSCRDIFSSKLREMVRELGPNAASSAVIGSWVLLPKGTTSTSTVTGAELGAWSETKPQHSATCAVLCLSAMKSLAHTPRNTPTMVVVAAMRMLGVTSVGHHTVEEMLDCDALSRRPFWSDAASSLMRLGGQDEARHDHNEPSGLLQHTVREVSEQLTFDLKMEMIFDSLREGVVSGINYFYGTVVGRSAVCAWLVDADGDFHESEQSDDDDDGAMAPDDIIAFMRQVVTANVRIDVLRDMLEVRTSQVKSANIYRIRYLKEKHKVFPTPEASESDETRQDEIREIEEYDQQQVAAAIRAPRPASPEEDADGILRAQRDRGESPSAASLPGASSEEQELSDDERTAALQQFVLYSYHRTMQQEYSTQDIIFVGSDVVEMETDGRFYVPFGAFCDSFYNLGSDDREDLFDLMATVVGWDMHLKWHLQQLSGEECVIGGLQVVPELFDGEDMWSNYTKEPNAYDYDSGEPHGKLRGMDAFWAYRETPTVNGSNLSETTCHKGHWLQAAPEIDEDENPTVHVCEVCLQPSGERHRMCAVCDIIICDPCLMAHSARNTLLHFIAEHQQHNPLRKSLPFGLHCGEDSWRGFVSGTLTVSSSDDAKVTAAFSPEYETDEGTTVDVTVKALQVCPHHDVRLVASSHHVHRALRRSDPRLYNCSCSGRSTLSAMACGEEEALRGCKASAFYVCPDARCNFAVCDTCYNADVGAVGAVWRKGVSFVAASDISSGLEFQLAQVIYLPCVQWCLVVLLCKFPIACSFRGCYNPAEPGFAVLASMSAIVLTMFGGGLVLLLTLAMLHRKRMILSSHVVEAAEKRGVSHQVWTMSNIMFVNLEHETWTAITKYDTSHAKCFYAPYEFKYMVFIGPLLSFKVYQLMFIMNLRSNSTEQLTFAALLEAFQWLLYMFTDPFTNPWLDALAKGGFLHQIAQLGLLNLYRDGIMEDPYTRGITPYVMVLLGVAYVGLVIAFIVVMVVHPYVNAKKAEKVVDDAFEQEHADRLDAVFGRQLA
jgi:hypothetical protein